ncbi:hypothetical protein ZEAMMB73_Zm00001d023993 [Zea mays]|nr:hypothetical protein ZEAMMB73_Zm00001d023993 [Zea mays]
MKPFMFCTVAKGSKVVTVVWNISDWERIGYKRLLGKPISTLSVSLDGKYLALESRDIKAFSILLDFKFEAKVADFGLAKFTTNNNTHISTRVMGTFGYLAPEYAASGKLTEKSDVFSFGVMLLELITGWRPIDTTQLALLPISTYVLPFACCIILIPIAKL